MSETKVQVTGAVSSLPTKSQFLRLWRARHRRKNWLFAGSENGAERGCVLYSLLATCKLHGVNPFEYLRDVIMRVGGHPARDVLELSPKAWKNKLQDLHAARCAPSPAA